MKALKMKPKTLFRVKRFLKECGINLKELSNIDVTDPAANSEVFKKVLYAIEDFEDLESEFFCLLSEILSISIDEAESLTLEEIAHKLKGLVDTTDKKTF